MGEIEHSDGRRLPVEAGSEFYSSLPVQEDFRRIGDPSVYKSLPDGWVVGVADIVRSTDAIAAGGYKRVNTVAAAVIAAIANELDGEDFPFVFGGDGAGFALPADRAAVGERALMSVAAWASNAFDLTLRIALLPIARIRQYGHDVKIARFSPSGGVAYAMFDGGGLAWAERRMKAGEFRLEPRDEGGAGPKLDGLSCRFNEIPSRRGVILSVVVSPAEAVSAEPFAALMDEILAGEDDLAADGNPVPPQGPDQVWPPAGLAIEQRVRGAARGGRSGPLVTLQILFRTFLAHLVFKSGIKVGQFEPGRYLSELAQNSDFRKFGDGLKMTIDCTPAFADRIEARLRKAEEEGIVRFGTHRQKAALMTCFVPSASRSDHVHFVDGAMGGYSVAAMIADGRSRAEE